MMRESGVPGYFEWSRASQAARALACLEGAGPGTHLSVHD